MPLKMPVAFRQVNEPKQTTKKPEKDPIQISSKKPVAPATEAAKPVRKKMQPKTPSLIMPKEPALIVK